MPELTQVALFGAAVFLAVLTPILWLTQSPHVEDDDDDDLPFAEPEPVLYDHPLILDRIWDTLGGSASAAEGWSYLRSPQSAPVAERLGFPRRDPATTSGSHYPPVA